MAIQRDPLPVPVPAGVGAAGMLLPESLLELASFVLS